MSKAPEIHFTVPAGAQSVTISFSKSEMDMDDYDVRLITTDPSPGTPERLAELMVVRRGNG